MGFHKRWLSEEKLRGLYRNGGIESLKLILRADAFILEDDFSSKFLDIFNDYKEEEELQEKIKQHFNVH
jgi:hypothetical protein